MQQGIIGPWYTWGEKEKWSSSMERIRREIESLPA